MMKKIDTRALVLLASLAALQVVFSKFLMIQATPSVRFSVDSTPIILAGLWYGPVAGALVGALADMLGTILFPTAGAWYPPLTAAYVLIGLLPGLIGRYIVKKRTLPAVAGIVVVTEAVASLIVKSLALSSLRGIPFPVQLAARILPVAVNTVANVTLVYALHRAFVNRANPRPARVEAVSAAPDNMSYGEALAFIHSVDWRGTVFGLERVEAVLKELGNPEKTLKFVHVAGTNGKGSTAAMLAAILQSAGYRTGLYISPYINRFNERIQIDGEPISDADLARLATRVRSIAKEMADPPTEFETVTALGLKYFAEQGCDIVVLEVGMGGRLDATNVIPVPEVAVITRIGLDHTKTLGGTIEQIAFEKAGVIKEGGDVVLYGGDPEADPVFERACTERRATLTKTDFSRIRNVTADLDRLRFDFLPYEGLELRLVGLYQPYNAAVALTAIERLTARGWRIGEEHIRRGLMQARWPARFEVLSRDPVVIVDGGHNPQGVRAAVESLAAHFPGRRITFVLGVMADKAVAEMLDLIVPAAERVIAVTPDNPRALPAAELANMLTARGVTAEAAPGVESGVRRAIELAGPDGVVCALGSLYMSGAVRSCFFT